MPPHVPRKRMREVSPDTRRHTPNKHAKGKAAAPPRKLTLFDDLDATASPQSVKRKGEGKAAQQPTEISDDDDESSLTSLSDADFEAMSVVSSPAKLQKVEETAADGNEGEDEDEDEEDQDIEFEDVSYYPTTLAPHQASGSLDLTLSHVPTVSYTESSGRKGPSKTQRQVRVGTHCIHVQFLMWHNAVRNAWLCDPEVQGIMLSHLSLRLWDEVDRWRRACGLDKHVEEAETPPRAKGQGKKAERKPARDWGEAAQRLENGNVDMSHGDPLFRLLGVLSSWWRQRFRVTAPGIRKMGYMPTRMCTDLIKGFRDSGGLDPDRYGERIPSLREFRQRAQACSGSRDVGAQLFTALLRGLSLEARMVATLQPIGFGWTKREESDPEKHKGANKKSPREASEGEFEAAKSLAKKQTTKRELEPSPMNKAHIGKQIGKPGRRSLSQKNRGNYKEEESEDSDLALSPEDSGGASDVEMPPATSTAKKSRSYDKDLGFPHYWAEVLSPVTNLYIPVDPIVKSVVGTNREIIESFEPRGAKADQARQVMAYVVGFSQDGTAKDVTVRYLKRQVLPGRTKGVRMTPERIPVFNKNGKVKSHEQHDWFKAVISGYVRGGREYPRTEIDVKEDETSLKPAQRQQKQVKEGEETLQYYKQSQEFVLERHLRREEALLPTAEPVRVFKNKGKKGETEEMVYSRKDVVQVKSAETWHKQGRAPKPGEQAAKKVPYRAATTNRRREIAEAEAASGQKVLQGLYAFEQTDWIIPPPIKNGVIPKNAYGNIDLFVEHMCPEGAVHVPYRGAMRVCKRLQIDFAEAVVDFEFGHRMAVPVIQGVVIAEEYHDQVVAELAKDEAEKARKEDEKRRKAALAAWRKLLMGMRIVERVRREYGNIKEEFRPFGRSQHDDREIRFGDDAENGEDMAGGFLPEGFEAEQSGSGFESSSFFPVVDEENEDHDEGYALVVEDGSPTGAVEETRPTMHPGQSCAIKKGGEPQKSLRRRTRRTAIPSSGDEDEDGGGDEGMGNDSDFEE